MPSDPREEVRAQLTGPGGPFEMVEEDVLGVRLPVFRSRLRSLRELLQNAAAHGESDYIVCDDERIRYADLPREVASVAAALRDRYGVGPGDRVAILAANCPEWVLSFWAAVSLGAIVSALNGWWTADEIRYGVGHCEPRLLIGDRKRLARVDGVDLGVPVLEIERDFRALRAHAKDAELPSQPIDEDDPSVILYTSGTTGRPKGAVCSHRALLGFVQCNTLQGLERVVLAAREGGAPAGAPAGPPCALVTVPLFHLSGLFTAGIMMANIGGKTVYRRGRFDPEDVLRLIERERVTMWSALGDTGARVIEHPSFGDYDVSSVVNVGFGGAPTSPALQERMKRPISAWATASRSPAGSARAPARPTSSAIPPPPGAPPWATRSRSATSPASRCPRVGRARSTSAAPT